MKTRGRLYSLLVASLRKDQKSMMNIIFFVELILKAKEYFNSKHFLSQTLSP